MKSAQSSTFLSVPAAPCGSQKEQSWGCGEKYSAVLHITNKTLLDIIPLKRVLLPLALT